MDRIGVFLSDWQVLFREGIHFTLSGEEDFEVIGETTNNEDALKAIESNPPDVAVLNTNHEKLDGFRVAAYLKRNFPSVATVLIMDNDDDEQLFQAIKSGASACVTKEIEPADLIDTIRAAAQGKQPISDALLRPEIASRVLDEFEEFTVIGEQMGNIMAQLTPGETEILHHLANGAPLDQIYQALSIGEEGISRTFKTILSKLVANEQSRQIIAAIPTGLPMSVRAHLAGQSSEDYVTREEFSAFKDSIRERLKAAMDEAD
ncbi:MAG TPA: response regulator transcription factor [Dehalococcoidia bacterium]|nr:response regulator transcription factor [Dehalococcoidia bacterium]